MRLMLLFFCITFVFSTKAQTTDSLIADIEQFHQTLNEEYRDPIESPLDSLDRIAFTEHDFFPIDLNYRVHASFERTPDEAIFQINTSGPKRPEYVKFGVARFDLNGQQHTLSLYQNVALSQRPEFENYLFLPFTDNSNGVQTYGGGRYIDLTIPNDTIIIIDFNKAYNPYCAYSDQYSCPIPPKENHLDTDIEAGIRYTEEE